MSDARPNIMLITTDQQRGDCLGIDPDGPDCPQTPCLLYTSPSPRDRTRSRMPSSA